MEMLEVGKIINTHGLRGEMKVVSWTDTPEVFEELTQVYIKRKGETLPLEIRSVKYQKNNLIIKFSGIDRIEDAEKYKTAVLLARREDLGELPEGVYYIADLIGLTVEDEEGQVLGVLEDVFQTGSNNVYTVKREGKKELLLPVLPDVVLKTDLEAGRITVRVPEGLDEE